MENLDSNSRPEWHESHNSESLADTTIIKNLSGVRAIFRAFGELNQYAKNPFSNIDFFTELPARNSSPEATKQFEDKFIDKIDTNY